MKPHYCFVAFLLMAGTAMAQDPQTQTTKTSKRDTTTSASTNAQTEMKMQTYKGTLMDASCAMGGAEANTGKSSTAERSAAATPPETPASPETPKSKRKKGEASRSQGAGQGQACSVSSNTTEFALKLDDGRTMKFDSVGNLRAQDALKTKKWQEAASSGKPIQAKVTGAMLDDKLLVDSIH